MPEYYYLPADRIKFTEWDAFPLQSIFRTARVESIPILVTQASAPKHDTDDEQNDSCCEQKDDGSDILWHSIFSPS